MCHLFSHSGFFFSKFIYFLPVSQGMQDLSSMTRDGTCAPWSGTRAPWSGNIESQPLDQQGCSPYWLLNEH